MSEERGQVSQERGAEGIAMSAEVARWLAVPFQEIQGTMAGGGGGWNQAITSSQTLLNRDI